MPMFGLTERTELITEVLNIRGFSQGTPLSISTSAAQTAALTEGFYDVWSSVDAYIKVETTATDVTSSNGYLIRTGSTVTVAVPAGCKLGAIAGSSGTLSYHRVL